VLVRPCAVISGTLWLDDVIDGVVVMVVSPEKEGGEAVFINIVGEIDPEKIGKVAETLDIDLN